MNLRHYGNKARQYYWLIHIDAWRRSGVTRTEYCRKHRLTKGTFDRWLEYLLGADAARKHAEYQAQLRREKRLAEREKRRRNGVRRHYAVSTDTRNRALQAFWAMHVEAMNWSGMSIRDYAGSLHLSPHTLRRWCLLLESGEVEIDWRAHLHPSARPVVSAITNGRAPRNDLTEAPSGEPTTRARPVRRFFSDEQKRAIALESDQPGLTVSSVARKHGIATGLLFRWRTECGVPQKKRARLASVTQADGTLATLSLRDLVQPPADMMAVDLADGRRAFVPVGSNPDVVRAQGERGEFAS
ncbi:MULTISPECIES: IS66 family insertion sequence element accessory protein TnpA [unclassified Bradyrhizobium]|uniref:IS66 family insertion sequence element accessory protein TnpA n=1 Tax=Bradyrhizobium sp. USDA 4541 TaxID=2817704 RepID=UPI0020A33B14|nr:transposase [Bradyrhizobium sp. USDA 4541]MCP1848171.1 transposase-like protein [Bradyrhizobium sp. USDA 4541]